MQNTIHAEIKKEYGTMSSGVFGNSNALSSIEGFQNAVRLDYEKNNFEEDGVEVVYASNFLSSNITIKGMFSSIDEKSKYSGGYQHCTGIAGIGMDKDTNRYKSFLTHQDPTYYFEEGRESKLQHIITQKIAALQEICIPETLHTYIVGGIMDDEFEKKIKKDYYNTSYNMYAELFQKYGLYNPLKVMGYCHTVGSTSIYINTQEGQIFAARGGRDGKQMMIYTIQELLEILQK